MEVGRATHEGFPGWRSSPSELRLLLYRLGPIVPVVVAMVISVVAPKFSATI